MSTFAPKKIKIATCKKWITIFSFTANMSSLRTHNYYIKNRKKCQ